MFGAKSNLQKKKLDDLMIIEEGQRITYLSQEPSKSTLFHLISA